MSNDLISRSVVMDYLREQQANIIIEKNKSGIITGDVSAVDAFMNFIVQVPAAREVAAYDVDKVVEQQKIGRWIPVTYHATTDNYGIGKKRYSFCLDCPMPEDEQEILVCNKEYTWVDTCYIDDKYSLDSGNDWIDDIVAWMPLPEPYEPEN